VFSPGGGGSKNSLTIRQRGTAEDAWESGIYTVSGEKIRSFATERGSPGPRVWDGKNDSGAIVNDGVYTYRIEVTDRAQNFAEASMENIVVNTIRPTVSVVVVDPWFSPNGDGVKDNLGMSLTVPVKEEVVGWSVQIRDGKNNTVRTIQGKEAPDQLAFDGKNDAGAILAEGQYSGVLSRRRSKRNGHPSAGLAGTDMDRRDTPGGRFRR